MKIKRGAEVYTQDEKKAGDIARVVIDPTNYEITHLVVEKGFIFTKNKLVPIDLVGTATDDRVNLRLKENELNQLRNLVETHFIPGDPTKAYLDSLEPPPHPIYWYPPAGTVWWSYGSTSAYVIPPYVTRSTMQIPDGTVALDEGARLISSDGRHIGNLDEVLTDVETNRATHLVISAGFLLKDRKLVPTMWIKEVKADEVRLSIGSELFAGIPDYEPKL